MRRVGGARREIHEERFVGCERLLLTNPSDRPIRQVLGERVALLRRLLRFNGLGALEQGRVVLVGLATDEAIEMLETRAGRPLMEWPDRGDLHTGTSWHLPNWLVEYPLRRKVSASGAFSLGRMLLLPGADVAISVIPPIPTEWWLRPVNSACRVGEHNAVVWKRLSLTPPAANRSAVGVLHGPPKAEDAPKPTSSINTINTLGAPSGPQLRYWRVLRIFGSFASYVVRPTCWGSGIGRMSRRTAGCSEAPRAAT